MPRNGSGCTIAVKTSSTSRHTAAPCNNLDEYTIPLGVFFSPDNKEVESRNVSTILGKSNSKKTRAPIPQSSCTASGGTVGGVGVGVVVVGGGEEVCEG